MNTRKINLTLIIGAVLMSLMIFVSRTKAAENGKIAFVSNNDIWTMKSNGSGRTQIADSGERPKFSPDGTKIAFYGAGVGNGAIYLINADGSNQKFLTTGSFYIDRKKITWSPDGSKIAFTCETYGRICTVNAADGSNRTIINNNLDDYAPDWSPDGSKIAFTRKVDGGLHDEIYVMDINGNNQKRLTKNDLPDIKPVWSPDGAKLAFSRYYNCIVISNGEVLCFGNSIYTMNAADGSNQTLLASGSAFEDNYIGEPRWSPDGTKIIFWGGNDLSSETEIFVISSNGGKRKNLTNTIDVSELYPDWGTASASPNRTPFDFDGDRRADISVFRPSDRVWYLNKLTDGFTATQFGLSTDKITPADFDGDGKTDIAVFRNGVWYWLNSSDGNFNAIQFGLADDIPVPADYDGDRKADITIYRPSNGTWWTIRSSNGSVSVQQFGTSEDKPVAGDYDGDGRSDIAVYRPSQGVWHILQSSDNSYRAYQFGISEDKPVTGDYDGDSRNDLAVFRPSTGFWYILRSNDGSFSAVQFGLETDIPTPGDYDGDGKTDIAVFRPSNGVWYGLQSSNGNVNSQQFGLNGDTPTPAAFVRQ